MPGRLAPCLRDVPPAGRPLQSHSVRNAQGGALPDQPRRARGVRGAAPGRPCRAPGRHRPAGRAARHRGPTGRGGVRRRGVVGGWPVRPRPTGGAVRKPLSSGLRRRDRARLGRDHHGTGPAGGLRAPGPRERAFEGAAGGPAGRAHQRGRDPRARRLPRGGGARRHVRRDRERGLGHREHGRRRLPARHDVMAHPAGRTGDGAGRRRSRSPAVGAVLAGRGSGQDRGAFDRGLRAASRGRGAPGRR